MIESPWIVSYTGRKVHPLNPSMGEIDIEDIAHALANTCRWGGHTKRFHSVAQHSVIVSNFFKISPLWGLLHDAAEAYLTDMPSLVKQFLPTMRYAEERLMDVIGERFDLPLLSEAEKKSLKQIDLAALDLEWKALINNPEGHSIGVDLIDVPKLNFELNGSWNPIEAERIFLKRFMEITVFEDYR
jgi:5'-deoxynucleotidase YfbR-like HD superfamily hydrolase